MRVTFIISFLIVLITFWSCKSSTETITESQLYNIWDFHTTSHMVYYGSDSAYHYFGKIVLLEKEKKYKVDRDDLRVEGEFLFSDKSKQSKAAYFSRPLNGLVIIKK